MVLICSSSTGDGVGSVTALEHVQVHASLADGMRFYRILRGADEYSLAVLVSDTGGKQWIWRGTIHGKRLDLGLSG